MYIYIYIMYIYIYIHDIYIYYSLLILMHLNQIIRSIPPAGLMWPARHQATAALNKKNWPPGFEATKKASVKLQAFHSMVLHLYSLGIPR